MSSPDRIAEHNQKWDALPEFPAWPYVMTTDDVDSWSDLLYARDLADEIEGQAEKLAADPIGVHIVQMQRMVSQADIDVLASMPLPAAMIDPWPTDLSNGLLAAWRMARGPRPAQLALTAAAAA